MSLEKNNSDKNNPDQAILTIRNILQILLMFIIFGLITYLAKILQPFVLAGLLALIFQPLVYKMKEKNIPQFLSLPLVAIITLGVLGGIGMVIWGTAQDVIGQGDFLLLRLDNKLHSIVAWLNTQVVPLFSTDSVIDLETGLKQILDFVNFKSISALLGGFSKSLGSFTTNFIMFALFYVMLLGGLQYYKEYIRFIAGDKEKGAIWLKKYEMIYVKIIKYLSTKSFISLLTGITAYLTCLAFGVKFAIFWGFITFILNFVPSIGSIISTIIASTFFMIQCETFAEFVLFTSILSFMQFIFGNLIEPKIMSARLSLNTPTVIFGLFLWGFLWGPIGMMLSVPLFVMTRVVLEEIPSLAFLGRMMGSSDEVNPKKKKNRGEKIKEKIIAKTAKNKKQTNDEKDNING